MKTSENEIIIQHCGYCNNKRAQVRHVQLVRYIHKVMVIESTMVAVDVDVFTP